MAGTVAIVGRPNVGKSTLFNRLTHTRAALVDDQPGVTRDRIYGRVYDEKTENTFTLIDTGGFETGELYYQPFADNIVWQQTEIAIAEADLVLLCFDGKDGIHPHDEKLVQYLIEKNKPVLYVVTKVDGIEKQESFWDFYSLGVEELISVSAAHNRGLDGLVHKIATTLKAMPGLDDTSRAYGDAIKIALIGRPNVGKSSILNRIIGQPRSLVSEVAGTTRDPVDTPLTYNGSKYVLIDTAGIRRRARVTDKLETISVIMSLKAIERADIVCLIINAEEGLTDQDSRLAALAIEQCRPLAIIVNKWDLVKEKTPKTAAEYTKLIHAHMAQMAYVPVMFISCKENLRVHKIMSLVEELACSYTKRAETSLVNDTLAQMVREHTPALIHGRSKRVKFFYATQVKTSPPTIVAFCNVADEVQESYKRYMTNRFRDALGFKGIPIHLILRGKKEVKERKEASLS